MSHRCTKNVQEKILGTDTDMGVTKHRTGPAAPYIMHGRRNWLDLCRL